MNTEARKLHLITEVLRITSEETLAELEIVLEKSKDKEVSIGKKSGIYDFVGILTKEEAGEMRKAIEETCETINADEWK